MPLPLLLASAGISAANSVIGGAIQGNAAEKAKDASIHAQQQARIDQQRAANEVRGLQAPGVQAYNNGLNALTGRLGLPTAGVQAAITNSGQEAGADYLAYVQNNPDLLAEGNRVVGKGEFATLEDYGRWHRQTFGAQGRELPTRGLPPADQTQQPAAGAPPAQQNALTGNPGTFGNTQDPTWTPPAAYEAPTYDAPSAFQFDLETFKNDPGLQWALSQGTGQVQAGAGAGGYLQSGAAMKAIADRGQKTGYTYFAGERDSAYNRYANDRSFGRSTFENDRGFGYGQYLDNYRLGRANYESDRNYLTGRYDQGTNDLFRYLGVGQDALASTSNAISGAGTASANAAMGIGNAQAGNALQQGSIWSGVAGDLGGIAKGLVGGIGGGIGATSSIPTTGIEGYTRASGINPFQKLSQMPQVNF